VTSDPDPRHPSADYLEALYELREEGYPPIQAELARWMGVSRASVSEHVKRLVADGLLTNRDRDLDFTTAGLRAAVTLVRRHRLAEHLLIDVVGLPWHKAHAHAERWEQVIDDEIEERLVTLLADPGACPHGNPIPGSANEADVSSLVALTGVEPGSTVVLRRLTEDLELELDVMRYFEESHLMPGARITVRTVAPDGTVSLEADGVASALGPELADNLWVQPGA
jgi:DtxR family Mn-dependent transcriptional regulator